MNPPTNGSPATPVDNFVQTFIVPRNCRRGKYSIAPQMIEGRFIAAVERANHPEKYAASQDPRTVARERRNALQSIRRIHKKYPAVAALLVEKHRRGLI